MAESENKLPAQKEQKSAEAALWRPFENLRREVSRIFEDFDRGFGLAPSRRSAFQLEPLWPRETAWASAPAIDFAEKSDAYEITADLPGVDENNIEIKLSAGSLTISGQKEEEKEEKEKDYYLHERRFGSFERRLRVPESVDTDRIEASFKHGVLKLTLPKKPDAQKPEKKIEVKAA